MFLVSWAGRVSDEAAMQNAVSETNVRRTGHRS